MSIHRVNVAPRNLHDAVSLDRAAGRCRNQLHADERGLAVRQVFLGIAQQDRLPVRSLRQCCTTPTLLVVHQTRNPAV